MALFKKEKKQVYIKGKEEPLNDKIYYAQFYTIKLLENCDVDYLRQRDDLFYVKRTLHSGKEIIYNSKYNKIPNILPKQLFVQEIPDKEIVVVAQNGEYGELLSGEKVNLSLKKEISTELVRYKDVEPGSYYEYTPEQIYYCMEIKPLSINNIKDVKLIADYYEEYRKSQSEKCPSTTLQEIIDFCKKTVEKHPDKVYDEYAKNRETVKSLIKHFELKK